MHAHGLPNLLLPCTPVTRAYCRMILRCHALPRFNVTRWFCASARGVSGPVRACVLSEFYKVTRCFVMVNRSWIRGTSAFFTCNGPLSRPWLCHVAHQPSARRGDHPGVSPCSSWHAWVQSPACRPCLRHGHVRVREQHEWSCPAARAAMQPVQVLSKVSSPLFMTFVNGRCSR